MGLGPVSGQEYRNGVPRQMKVLIASTELEASKQLNERLGVLAPHATYFHAADPERTLDVLKGHRIDLAVIDIQLLAKDEAAVALLRLMNPNGLSFNPLKSQLESLSSETRPGVLLTFDGGEIQSTVTVLTETLKGKAEAESAPSESGSGTIWAQSEAGNWESVEVQKIQWAVSEQGRVRLQHLSQQSYFVRDRLKELELQLASRFVRIHKSYLVNPRHVTEVQRWSSGGLLVKMKDAKQTLLPVSRRYARPFRRKTGWSVGPVRAYA